MLQIGEFKAAMSSMHADEVKDRLMEALEDKGSALRKLGIPVTAGAIAAGAGLILTRKKSGQSLPDISDLGVGELADDLRRKLDSVLNRTDQPKDQPKGERRSASSATRHVDLDELAQRRREREQRRSQRRRKN